MSKIDTIGVFTSGGDAPGMNAAIRAVVRGGLHNGLKVFGIYRGYEGMIEGDIEPLTNRSVGNILQKGGTFLKTARSKEFKTEEGMRKALENLRQKNIQSLIGIGGDGSLTGLHNFSKFSGIAVMGIPGTIDNDLGGTEYTIGFDSATNTVIESVDKIRDTALSHNRLFFIEVMGRDAGHIAAATGLASGAIATLVPERDTDIEMLYDRLDSLKGSKKASKIIIVAEGGKMGNASKIADLVAEKFPEYETKVTILGHLQRGGAPSTFDRIIASKMGIAAVESLIKGQSDLMVGIAGRDVTFTPIKEALAMEGSLDQEIIRISEQLSS